MYWKCKELHKQFNVNMSYIDNPTAEQEGRAIFYSDYHLIQISESCEVTFVLKGNEFHWG